MNEMVSVGRDEWPPIHDEIIFRNYQWGVLKSETLPSGLMITLLGQSWSQMSLMLVLPSQCGVKAFRS